MNYDSDCTGGYPQQSRGRPSHFNKINKGIKYWIIPMILIAAILIGCDPVSLYCWHPTAEFCVTSSSNAFWTIDCGCGFPIKINACSWVRGWLEVSLLTDSAYSVPALLDLTEMACLLNSDSLAITRVNGKRIQTPNNSLLFPLDTGAVKIVVVLKGAISIDENTPLQLKLGTCIGPTGQRTDIPIIEMVPPKQ